MPILNATPTDITAIFRLYDIATAYQRSKGVVEWPKFKRSLVETEIQEDRQWKLVMDGRIACVWATTFSDPDIWEERNQDPAVYIHRIATNPDFRGQNFVQSIVAWARAYATKHHKHYIRLDTLGRNEKLIQHYTQAGFSFLGIHRLSQVDRLPLHYQREPDCCLFEISLD